MSKIILYYPNKFVPKSAFYNSESFISYGGVGEGSFMRLPVHILNGCHIKNRDQNEHVEKLNLNSWDKVGKGFVTYKSYLSDL